MSALWAGSRARLFAGLAGFNILDDVGRRAEPGGALRGDPSSCHSLPIAVGVARLGLQGILVGAHLDGLHQARWAGSADQRLHLLKSLNVSPQHGALQNTKTYLLRIAGDRRSHEGGFCL